MRRLACHDFSCRALPLSLRSSHQADTTGIGVMQEPGSAAADDRFARPDVAELTIELATE
jgi:hypothetical protein